FKLVDPGGFSSLPHAAGQPQASGKMTLARDGHELGQARFVGHPYVETTQHSSAWIYRPNRTDFPADALADGLKQMWNGLFQGCRLGQHAGDGILSGATLTAAHALADVAEDHHAAAGCACLVAEGPGIGDNPDALRSAGMADKDLDAR